LVRDNGGRKKRKKKLEKLIKEKAKGLKESKKG